MKTVDSINICPYPGLRSFTEEESLYFKGRDEQVDQVTALLEQNKFLMVTGASGEGKSSLIYAGLIPNARAGFFKAKYSNWVVATFRPERSPLNNMAAAIAGQLNAQAGTVETELRRGFSSLVDLYLNSGFYIGEEEAFINQLPENEKKERKRKAANLLILVDQFEEFFTSPENFYNESPSKDAQIVINLLLETARIAIKRNLPVYIVCTMRSDYIGQCSAFRGLPEYIGFSQFFVPRLKRKDLKQVIEEPAILSGNRISQRLIERLVFDIADGVDQLPILQHALSQVWLAADHGNEEMDLLYYAMAGGMPEDELPDQDKPRFREWLEGLPKLRRSFYKETGLNKVIEIHANILYENAWEYYNQDHPENPITQQDAKRIIALTFSCLTKIDNSRAVRNRMSLSEITGIINSPKITTEVTGAVINIFREQGNSFVHPFKTDDATTQILQPETVLDITHESLIRNWNKLNKWANKEFEYYSTYLDFKKQLDRWKNSGRSRGYLLPVGPLSYFENWYKKCNPNSNWIMRYSGNIENKAASEQEAQNILKDTREFLKKSARKETISRAFMKYGPQRIATVAAILLMLGLSGFYWYDAGQKKNTTVIEKVRKESFALLTSQEVNIADKANYLLAEERYDAGSMIPYLQKMEFRNRVKLANELYKEVQYVTGRKKNALKDQLFTLLAENFNTSDKFSNPDYILTEKNKFLILLAMDNYYVAETGKTAMLTLLAEKNYALVIQFLQDTKLYRPGIPVELNMAIQFWLTFGKPSPEKVSSLLAAFSPIAGKDAENTFNIYYPKGSFEPNGRGPSDFNGGYHTLACLYATIGDAEHVKYCFNQLLLNDQRAYFEQGRLLNNHLNVIGYLYQFGYRKEVPKLLQWLSANTHDNPPLTILRNIILRSGYISHLYPLNYERNAYRSYKGYIYPNLYFCERPVFDAVNEDYEMIASQTSNKSERNFLLAMNDKRKAMFYDKYWFDRNLPVDEKRLDAWLKEAVQLYSAVDTSFLEGMAPTTVIYNTDGVRTSNVKRKDLFIYPDYRDGWFSLTYHSDYFFNYLQKNRLLDQLYKTATDLEAIHLWVSKAFEWKTQPATDVYNKVYPIPDHVLTDIISFVNRHPEGKAFDKNIFYLVLANRSFETGDSLHGVNYFRQLSLPGLKSSSQKYEYLEEVFILNMMKQLCGNLAIAGRNEEAVKLAEQFTESHQQAITYVYMAEKLYRLNANPMAFVYLDSAVQKSKSIDYSQLVPLLDPSFNQVRVLSEIGSSPINKQALNILHNIPEESKIFGIISRVAGVAYEGNYYRAYSSIPKTLTESEDLQCRTMILLEAAKEKERKRKDTRWKAMDAIVDWDWDYTDFSPH
jgi:energy-coupling factor transporter ATP-binding protein EcfA2